MFTLAGSQLNSSDHDTCRMPSCVSALKKCTSSNSNTDCRNAQTKCGNAIENPILNLVDDVYDVRNTDNGETYPQPPEYYATWLGTVRTQIGAKQTYQECANSPYNQFSNSGDSKSFPADLPLRSALLT